MWDPDPVNDEEFVPNLYLVRLVLSSSWPNSRCVFISSQYYKTQLSLLLCLTYSLQCSKNQQNQLLVARIKERSSTTNTAENHEILGFAGFYCSAETNGRIEAGLDPRIAP